MKNPFKSLKFKFTCLFLRESSVLANMISQVSSVQYVHNQVKVLSILESVVHVDNERVVQLSQDLSFVHNRLDATLCNDSGFGHLLHSVLLLGFLPVNLPNLTEASLTHAILIIEVILSES